MQVDEHKKYLSTHLLITVRDIFEQSNLPVAIRGVSIPKKNGKLRLLGIPTVVDRYLQQAVSQILMTRFELKFSNCSYSFRPKKNLHQALIQSLSCINSGYQDIADIDLSIILDEVAHYKILQLIYEKAKCKVTMRLIRKWLLAPILIDCKLKKRRKGIPQGPPLSPLLSNILLDQPNKYLEQRGFKFNRYADDYSIYTKSKSEARSIGH